MSSSVIVARTRMCQTIVAIIRGGNFCGAAWQRPQLARKRCSPCMRMASTLSLLLTTEVFTLAFSPSFLRGGAAAYASETSTNTAVRIVILTSIMAPRALREMQAIGDSYGPEIHISIG